MPMFVVYSASKDITDSNVTLAGIFPNQETAVDFGIEYIEGDKTRFIISELTETEPVVLGSLR